jgi:divalent metal cation (Fe/Co/Zn/Cd) transporter
VAQSAFLWGVVGSIAVEVVTLHSYYLRGQAPPARYHRFGFWVIRALLALVAGGLVICYGIESPILALHLGAATPLIVQSLANNAQKFLP